MASQVVGNIATFRNYRLPVTQGHDSRLGNTVSCSQPKISRAFPSVWSVKKQTPLRLHRSTTGTSRTTRFTCFALGNGGSEKFGNEVESGEYVKAIVEHVSRSDNEGHVLFLKVMDGSDLVLPVYIGQAEHDSLVHHLKNVKYPRPLTHDFMKNSLASLGYKVDSVAVTHRKDNTYYGQVFYVLEGKQGTSETIGVDARPSDAINLAVRSQAPIYINREVIQSSAQPLIAPTDPKKTKKLSVEAKFHEHITRKHTCTLDLRASLTLAVREGRVRDAESIRDQLAKVLENDYIADLLLRLEQAISDERYDDAASIRDALHKQDMEQDLEELKKINTDID
mmetsp:Transcript_21716/g.26152  ORF Transcript_21716/g.26152 Transcript_21716/m.26152 type:complete len:338 (+) Transcript_21716:229-1242(+)|eukprot:CAMPEP_0197851858 /NCGR_PEP_ID=MMETSP1438-20131217/19041_1 /TAXON_ID=1461541 /ORGANISM="Pterosperma sp., Strain CCMP1384" /LENGTH=337 /DNA_ID=CAMNT_0043465617 /DNA_START=227 /DNA_END=1240 /DNA_ORIENTATION=+